MNSLVCLECFRDQQMADTGRNQLHTRRQHSAIPVWWVKLGLSCVCLWGIIRFPNLFSEKKMECVFLSEVGCDAPGCAKWTPGRRAWLPKYHLGRSNSGAHFSRVNKGWPLITLSAGQSRERLEWWGHQAGRSLQPCQHLCFTSFVIISVQKPSAIPIVLQECTGMF